MNIIKTIIADFDALLKRIETDVSAHINKGTALALMDQAKAVLAQHPDASAVPSAIVSPGKEAPATETDAPAPAAAPATGVLTDNDPSVKSGA